ncbi:MAG: hypothetical protein WC119_01735, partial [Synergistaceae bacterium]
WVRIPHSPPNLMGDEMKKILYFVIIAACTFMNGCEGELKINAPSDMYEDIKYTIKDIENCWEANNIPSCEPMGRITVQKIKGEKDFGSLGWAFQYNGKWVGGLATGSCRGGNTKILIAVNPYNGSWNYNVLRHELCHFLDYSCNCLLTHDPIYVPCCPIWLSTSIRSAESSYSVSKEIGNEFIDIIIFGEVSPSDSRAEKEINDWLNKCLIEGQMDLIDR